MKKLLGIVVLVLFLANNSFAEVYIWTCLDSKTKDFQQVFKIDVNNKTIEHLTSYNFANKIKYDVFKKDKIIDFKKDNAWSLTQSRDNSYTMRYYDFKNGSLYQSGILASLFPDDLTLAYSNLTWECFKSN